MVHIRFELKVFTVIVVSWLVVLSLGLMRKIWHMIALVIDSLIVIAVASGKMWL